MDLYLVRHGVAFDRDVQRWPDDRERPLTADGAERFRTAARGLRRLVPRVELVLSSPFTRAWQTATILQHVAHWPPPTTCDGLESGHAPEEVADVLRRYRLASAALVGHEPDLHALAAYLLSGEGGASLLAFKKGGVGYITISKDVLPGTGELHWLLTPKVLRALNPA
ncbi:MAG: phosphohistidine phosphatase SixA [Chloroflexota bacterium]|nr:phosphohistidine phosphatase SixA [Chloroflexota bacterium]